MIVDETIFFHSGQFSGKGASIHIEVFGHGAPVQRKEDCITALFPGDPGQVRHNLPPYRGPQQAVDPLMKQQAFLRDNAHVIPDQPLMLGAILRTPRHQPVKRNHEDRGIFLCQHCHRAFICNLALVLVWHILGRMPGRPRCSLIPALLSAAAVKFLVLYLGIVKLAVPVLLKLPEQQAAVISRMFSLSQLATALLGGGLALLVLPVLKRALEKSQG